IEMPRFFSSSIQSEVVARWFLRAVTEPASCTAPPYSSSFSVNVVLPASGCEMMANVRRVGIFLIESTKRRIISWNRTGTSPEKNYPPHSQTVCISDLQGSRFARMDCEMSIESELHKCG